jgi:hypothetical protein
MQRKRYTKRQVVEFWEKANGRCWRCLEKIQGKPTPIYGKDWVLGHVGAAHWTGGGDVAPEHTDCNAIDGREQSKLAAKSVRIRAKAIGVKKPSRLAEQWAWYKRIRAERDTP